MTAMLTWLQIRSYGLPSRAAVRRGFIRSMLHSAEAAQAMNLSKSLERLVPLPREGSRLEALRVSNAETRLIASF